MLLQTLFSPFLALALFHQISATQSNSGPLTIIANVSVSDTPLVSAARDLAHATLTEPVYNHVMRSWLFAAVLRENSPATFLSINPETLAITTLLHDLGFDNSTFASTDKRFEVDGAIAAKNWVLQPLKAGKTKEWDDFRLELLWDSIAFHAEPSFSQHKPPVVALTSLGITCDAGGPNSDITKTLTWD